VGIGTPTLAEEFRNAGDDDDDVCDTCDGDVVEKALDEVWSGVDDSCTKVSCRSEAIQQPPTAVSISHGHW
jgi:hypothetical protein